MTDMNRFTSDRTRVIGFGGVAGALVASVCACMTTEQMAPPVQPAMVQLAEERGGSPTHLERNLERGRDLYLTDCARCHRIEPIASYSVAKWEEILEEMTHEANLDDEETEQLREYILTAHAFLQSAPDQ